MAGVVGEVKVFSFDDLNSQNITDSTAKRIEDALHKLSSKKIVNGTTFGPTTDHLNEKYFGGRINFIVIPNGYSGNLGSAQSFLHYPEYSIFSDGEKIGNPDFDDIKPFSIEKMAKERNAFLSKTPPESFGDHYITINLENLKQFEKKFGYDALPNLISHEITHAYDLDVIRRWIIINHERVKSGKTPDKLFTKFTKIKNGIVYLNQSFRLFLMEARAYVTETEVGAILFPEHAEKIKIEAEKALHHYWSTISYMGDLDVLESAGFSGNFLDSKNKGRLSIDAVKKALDGKEGVFEQMARTLDQELLKGKGCAELFDFLQHSQ